ncbi:MAG: MATE family efflux transporter [Lachnospiraceae bacterium]|nr:MATE family efflux transporter [Lachnospiraceae bacterium]
MDSNSKVTKDMTIGSPAKTLFFFAVPMVLGNIFQQFYSIIDSMVVGNFVGADALAAVGASTALTMLFIAVATGAGIGCSVVVSQFFGSKRLGEMMTAIYTVLITIFFVSVILTGIGLLLGETALGFMNTPDNIFRDSLTYLRIYLLGLPFLFMFNILNSIFNALGVSKIPLVLLGICSALNIFLDLLFVTRFHLGVAGVAWATLISQGVSAVVSFIWLMLRIRKIKVEEAYPIYQFSILKEMCYVAVPSIIQQAIVSIGVLAVQSLVNSFGSASMAGYTSATKIDMIAIMPIVNVGNALSTFTAQNIGAKKPERVKQGFRGGVMMIFVIAFSITAVLFVFGENFIGAFVDSAANPKVIETGVEYLRVVSMFYFLFGFMNACNGVLRGSSDMKVFMASTLCNFTMRVVCAYSLAATSLGMQAIWWSIPIGWAVGSVISFTRFLSGKWKEQARIG